MPAARSDGYSKLSILAHWIAAIAVIALFFTHEGSRDSATFAFHVSGGAVIGIFLLWRVARRYRLGMTDKPDQPALLNLASRIVLHGLLAAIVVVTLTGYLLPWTVGQPIDVYGIISIPSPIGANRSLHEFMEEAHDVSGHLFIPLIGLHILGAAKHAFFDRDGIARRMVASVAGGR